MGIQFKHHALSSEKGVGINYVVKICYPDLLQLTVCFSTCDTFDQPVRSTKFHQLLVIYDSFCSWMATNLIHNCNFDDNSKGWQWEPLYLRCQNSTILTFYPDYDYANLTHLNSDFFKSGFAQSSIRRIFQRFEIMNTQKKS